MLKLSRKNNQPMKNIAYWNKRRYLILQIILRILIGIIVSLAAISTIYIGRKPYGEELKEGDVSLRTIYAPFDFKYNIGIDEEKTKLEREKQAEAVEPIYEINPQITQAIINKMDKFFDQLIAIQNLKDADENAKLDKAKESLEIPLSELDFRAFLAEPNLKDAKIKSKNLLDEFLAQGLMSSVLEKDLSKSGRTHLVLRNGQTKEEAGVAVEELLTLDKVKKELETKVQNLFPESRKLRLALINLIQGILEPNLTFNEELTKKRRELAYANSPLQYKQKEVKKEELIISRGERVVREHLLKIKEMNRLQIKVNHLLLFSGTAILTLLFLSIIALYLKFYEPKIFLSTRKLALVGALCILILGLAKAIAHSPLPSYTIPTAIASILLAMFLGPRLAIIITFVLSIFVGIIAGDKLNVACVSFVGGIVGALFVQGARRRSQILIIGCLVGLANFVCICAIELLYGLKYTIFLKEGFWGIINGLGAAVIITGLLPIFEYLFNMVTNISLLELSDLNHPLLKEMMLNATGTYHHSLIVGNLAEAACENIGANALLARVGSYFHDIGKTAKAEYFSENQVGTAKKKHDKLTPSMSSLIITNHVKDGVELAHKYRLNQAVIDFIEQHHGTSLIFYFYQRALEKIEDEQLLEEEGFRYPGPKPQTKETAVVLLADSAEAASRTLNDPTPARIKGLVRKVINNKFIDNQLDQCELTLKDLEIIAELFSRILMGIFHSRIEYEPAEKTKSEDKNTEDKNKEYPEKNNHR